MVNIDVFVSTMNKPIQLNREHLTANLSVSDLTWEQKEQVLRELFKRMNENKPHMMLESRTQT